MFEIDIRSRTPIYEQLVESIKDHIIKGNLKPDDQLPSVRDLASSLAINPNTIAKAFRQLELEGFIYSVRGRGSYVMKLNSLLMREQKRQVVEQLRKNLADAVKLGMTYEQIQSVVASFYEEVEVKYD